jgi:dTDP-4-amino-4,6-dideoxygalactose transaminase
MWKIPLFDLDYDEREQKAVQEVLESKWLSSGKKTAEFESEFSNYLDEGVRSTAVSSATAALHISLLIAGIAEGDEVIVPGLTFVADANVVTMLNAIPVFYDVKSLENWNPSLDNIKSRVTIKTKAIIVVHFAGYPIEDIVEIVSFCKEKNIILIEDVAHAVGASYRNQKCGTFGDMSCFSFFSNKNLSTGEGGMFVTKSKEYSEKAKLFRSHGMTSMTIDRHEGRTISYDVVQPGLNYRIDELRCALGLVQLSKLDANNQKRETLVKYYIGELNKKVPSIIIPFSKISDKTISSYHIFPILLPIDCNRIEIMNKLKEKKIQTSLHYPSFKDFTFYAKYCDYELKNADKISKRVITLPLYPDLTTFMIDIVINSIKEIINE